MELTGRAKTPEARWLVLIHQIPPKPNYLRVKVWRQLQRLGAVAVKNTVYVLPRGERAYEDFQWVLRAITEGGGDGSVCEARFVDGLTDEQIEAMFRAARGADYAQILDDARKIEQEFSSKGSQEDILPRAATEVTRLRKRFAEIAAIDFFHPEGRKTVDGLLSVLEARVRGPRSRSIRRDDEPLARKDYRGRCWVTRKGIHVDRMASGWLIRRFIDPEAHFRFVDPKSYRRRAHELMFDMFDADFTHDGDRCTFETLIDRFALTEPALRRLAEIVHDIDLKDAKFGRSEAAGLACLVDGIAVAHPRDQSRLEHARKLFDLLYQSFRVAGSADKNQRRIHRRRNSP